MNLTQRFKDYVKEQISEMFTDNAEMIDVQSESYGLKLTHRITGNEIKVIIE